MSTAGRGKEGDVKYKVQVCGVTVPIPSMNVTKSRAPMFLYGLIKRMGPTSIFGRTDGDPRLLRALFLLFRDSDTTVNVRCDQYKIRLEGVRWIDTEGNFQALKMTERS